MKYLKKYEEVKTKIKLDEVFENCKEFISDLEKCEKGSFLVRGIGDDGDGLDFGIKEFKHDLSYRSPKDMPSDLHEELNYKFENSFGWQVRNGLFSFGRNIDLDKIKKYLIDNLSVNIPDEKITTWKNDERIVKNDAGRDLFLFLDLTLVGIINSRFSTGYGAKSFFVFPIDDYEIVWSRCINDLFSELEDDLEPNEYDAKEKYQEDYGKGADGQWIYYGKDTDRADIDAATDLIVDNWEQYTKYDINDYEDEDELKDVIWDKVNSDLEWEPYMDWYEFWDDYKDSHLSNLIIQLDDIISEYEDGDLDRAISSGNEVCIKTEKYYLIDFEFTEELIKRIWK